MDIQRRLVSYKTTNSWDNVPHVVLNYEADISDFYKVYQEMKLYFKEEHQLKLTMNTLIVKAIVEALKKAPKMNASCTFDKDNLDGTFDIHNNIDVDIPWILPDNNMLTLTVHDAQDKSLYDLILEMDKLAFKVENTDIDKLYENMVYEVKEKKAIEVDSNQLSSSDISKGTVTISNIGSLCNYPINFTLLDVLTPQVVTIGLSPAQDKVGVIADDGSDKDIAIRKILPICIAFDHRALDFGDILPFLNFLEKIFNNPHLIKEW